MANVDNFPECCAVATISGFSGGREEYLLCHHRNMIAIFTQGQYSSYLLMCKKYKLLSVTKIRRAGGYTGHLALCVFTQRK